MRNVTLPILDDPFPRPTAETVDHGLSEAEIKAAAEAELRQETADHQAWMRQQQEQAIANQRMNEAMEREAAERKRVADIEKARRQAIDGAKREAKDIARYAVPTPDRKAEREEARQHFLKSPAGRLKTAEATITDLVQQVAALSDRVLVLEGSGSAVTTEDGEDAKA